MTGALLRGWKSAGREPLNRPALALALFLTRPPVMNSTFARSLILFEWVDGLNQAKGSIDSSDKMGLNYVRAVRSPAP